MEARCGQGLQRKNKQQMTSATRLRTAHMVSSKHAEDSAVQFISKQTQCLCHFFPPQKYQL